MKADSEMAVLRVRQKAAMAGAQPTTMMTYVSAILRYVINDKLLLVKVAS